LLSLHNVFTMNRLMRDVRAGIAENNLKSIEKEWCVS